MLPLYHPEPVLKRDFSNENPVNMALRALRAAAGRVRGFIYYHLGFFHAASGRNLFFGVGCRFQNPRLMCLGQGVAFGQHARLECFGLQGQKGPLLIVGEGTTFGDGCHVGSISEISIGRDVLFGSYVLILDHTHGRPGTDCKNQNRTPPRQRDVTSKASVVIGSLAWIGDGAVILPGASIGEGAIIGANAVVRGHVPAWTIYTGAAT